MTVRFGQNIRRVPFTTGRQWSRTTSGQKYTPQQQNQLDLDFQSLGQRLEGVNPQQDFSQRMEQFGGPSPFTPIQRQMPNPNIGESVEQKIAAGIQRTQGQQAASRRERPGITSAAPPAGALGATSSPTALGQQELDRAISQGNYQTTIDDITNFKLGANRDNAAASYAYDALQSQQDVASLQEMLAKLGLGVQQQGIDVQQQNALYNQLAQRLRPLQSSQSVSGSFTQMPVLQG